VTLLAVVLSNIENCEFFIRRAIKNWTSDQIFSSFSAEIAENDAIEKMLQKRAFLVIDSFSAISAPNELKI
jgi:hypothetical protein